MKGISSPPVTDFCESHGTVVFNGTVASSNWQDLDLSAYVGANSAFCFFEIEFVGTHSNFKFRMKPKGYGSVTVTDQFTQGAAAMVEGGSASDEFVFLACSTDDNGIISMAYTDPGDTLKITLVNAIK